LQLSALIVGSAICFFHIRYARARQVSKPGQGDFIHCSREVMVGAVTEALRYMQLTKFAKSIFVQETRIGQKQTYTSSRNHQE